MPKSRSSGSSTETLKKLTVRRVNANQINCRHLHVHEDALVKNRLIVCGDTDLQKSLVVHHDTRVKKKLTVGDNVVDNDHDVGLVVEKKTVLNEGGRSNAKFSTHSLEVKTHCSDDSIRAVIDEKGVFLNHLPIFEPINTINHGRVVVDVYGYLKLVS
jgi:hypothetical protein